MFMFWMYCNCVQLIIGCVKDHLSVPRYSVLAVSLFLTYLSHRIAFSEGIACHIMSMMKLETSLYSEGTSMYRVIYFNVRFSKNMQNRLCDFLCISKVLNVVFRIILWYLNQKMHVFNTWPFSWIYGLCPYLENVL